MYLVQEEVTERSTLSIRCSFYDESGEYVLPTSIVWNLSDVAGNIINDRQNVEIETNPIITLSLAREDTTIAENNDAIRIITIIALYNSNIGEDLSLVEEIKFKIKKVRSLSI